MNYLKQTDRVTVRMTVLLEALGESSQAKGSWKPRDRGGNGLHSQAKH